MNKMLSFFRYILATILLFIGLLILGLILIAYFKEDNDFVGTFTQVFLFLFALFSFFVGIKIIPKKINKDSETKDFNKIDEIPNIEIEKIETEVKTKKKIYCLEGIAIADRLTAKGAERLKEKNIDLRIEIEKYDPFNLSDRASQEKYEIYSEKHEWLEERLQRSEDAIEIFEKLGHKKDGHGLTKFKKLLDIEFDYQKADGSSKRRFIKCMNYEYIDFKLYLKGKEEAEGIEKSFRFDRISNILYDGQNFKRITDLISMLINEKLAFYINTYDDE